MAVRGNAALLTWCIWLDDDDHQETNGGAALVECNDESVGVLQQLQLCQGVEFLPWTQPTIIQGEILSCGTREVDSMKRK